MSVTVDDSPLPARELGLRTIGQVLSHLQRENRIVVQLLVDGQEPDLADLNRIRQQPLGGRSVHIETADPRELALEVLRDVSAQLAQTERLKDEAADLLQQAQSALAMQRLAGCFTTWQHVQESVLKTGELLRLNLAAMSVDGRPLVEVLEGFSAQLRQIKATLEQRDFVSLADILRYETADTIRGLHRTLETLDQTVRSLR